MLLTPIQVPVNDSLRVRYSVRLEDGTLLPLTGFSVVVTVKASNSQAAPVIVTTVGVIQNPDTSAVVVIPPDTLSAAGQFYATVRAFNASESYSDTFVCSVVDHA